MDESRPSRAHPLRAHGGPGPLGPRPFDFSTNASPLGAPDWLRDALSGVDAARYPDPAYTALRHRIAQLHGTDARCVVIGASASECIQRITAAVAIDAGARAREGRVAVPRHAYGDYAIAARANGLHVVRYDDGCGVRGNVQGDGQGNVQGCAPDERPLMQWICDPSSPLGQRARIDPEAHTGLAGAALSHATLVVLDAVYAPLLLDQIEGPQMRTPGHGEPTQIRPDPALEGLIDFSLHSPGKALGLCGIRAGYLLMHREHPLLDRLDALSPSWPIGAHGVCLLEHWCDPRTASWLASQRACLRDWKHRFVQALESLGIECAPSSASFFCARFPMPDEGQLRAAGIALRDATSFGLSGWVRLGVQPPGVQDRLLALLRTSPAAGRPVSAR